MWKRQRLYDNSEPPFEVKLRLALEMDECYIVNNHPVNKTVCYATLDVKRILAEAQRLRHGKAAQNAAVAAAQSVGTNSWARITTAALAATPPSVHSPTNTFG